MEEILAKKKPRFRNNCLAVQSIRESCEFILSGPYETGKTFAVLYLLDSLLREFPGSVASILRKVRSSMDSTVLHTWKNVINIHGGVVPFGGNHPQWYDYKNGSRVYIAGLDDPQKSLSGERDFICIPQAEELDKEDWEVLSTRASGRAGNALDKNGKPLALLFGDCNPGSPNHWILNREKAGNLRLLPTSHRDNPSLYDDLGNITSRGEQSMKVLNALTGHQRSRGRDGLWCAATGLVFDEVWSEDPDNGNLTTMEFNHSNGPVVWWVDDGYTGKRDAHTGHFESGSHPRVFLLVQLLADGRALIFDESYEITTLDSYHLDMVCPKSKPSHRITDRDKESRFWQYPFPDYAVVDKSAAKLRAAIEARGIRVFHVAPKVVERIANSRNWIGMDNNGVRRLLVNKKNCFHFRHQMVSYVYKPGFNRDEVVKDHDDGPDAMGYGQWFEDFDKPLMVSGGVNQNQMASDNIVTNNGDYIDLEI